MLINNLSEEDNFKQMLQILQQRFNSDHIQVHQQLVNDIFSSNIKSLFNANQ